MDNIDNNIANKESWEAFSYHWCFHEWIYCDKKCTECTRRTKEEKDLKDEL